MSRRALLLFCLLYSPVVSVAQAPQYRFYGTLLVNASISDTLLFGQDVPLFASPGGQVLLFPDGSTARADTASDFILTVRQSTFGAQVSRGSVTGTVEADFFGTRTADGLQPQGRVLNQPRLRLAHFQLEKGNVKLLAGQAPAIIAPSDPVSFSHVALPMAATAGNLWARLPQVRVELKKEVGGVSALFQGGVLRPIFADPRLADLPPGGSAVDAQFSGFGERGSQPFYQARFSVSRAEAAIGVGAHYGRERIGADRELDSWAMAIDYSLPIHSRLRLRGENFIGSNLVPFQGGILQGIAVFQIPGSLPPPIFHKIGAAGGWAELTLKVTSDDRNILHIGAGTDDPRDRNLLPNSPRGKNTVGWASYFRKLNDDVTLATEWSNWQFRNILFVGPQNTGKATGRGNVLNVALAYRF